MAKYCLIWLGDSFGVLWQNWYDDSLMVDIWVMRSVQKRRMGSSNHVMSNLNGELDFFLCGIVP